jgi:type VI secretion system protein ImpH
MAATDRRTTPAVIDSLFAEPYRFDFYQAVKLLEWICPDAPTVGSGIHPRWEAVNFQANPGQAFPASSIQDLQPPARPGEPAVMTVNFLRLIGVNGPLPAPFSELVIERAARHDDGLRDFLDIFHHRLVSLQLRARRKHRLTLDRLPPHLTPFARYLFCLFGLGTQGLQNRLPAPDRALLPYAGILAHQPRSQGGLEKLLAHYFGVPVRCQPLQGAWYALAEDETTLLGKCNQGLGQGVVLGQRIWRQDWCFELRLGPLSWQQFCELLPTGSGFKALCGLTRFYVGWGQDFTFRLLPRPEEIPPARLGILDGSRLGWTAFLEPAALAPGAAAIRLKPSHG